MRFRPNFEINFKPSQSAFFDDDEQGLTHTSAGLSTEVIILGEDSEELEASISPYSNDNFLYGEGRIRDKVRREIQQGVKDKFGKPRANDCAYNEQKVREINDFMANPPDEIGGRKITSNARKSIATGEAQVQLENFEATIAKYCLQPSGEAEFAQAEEEITEAQLGLSPTNPMSMAQPKQAGIGGTALLILGGAVLLGGVIFFAIKR